MKPEGVREQIRSGETAPLYLLEGEDLQSRLELAAEITSVVDEGLHAFNVHSMHASDAATAAGRDQLIATLLAAARTLPMMAARRVIVVHDAERLLSPRKGKEDEAEAPADDTGKKRKRGTTPVEELEAYIAEPEPLTTVVFVAGAVDANRRLVKLLRKHAVVVDCGTLSNTADAAKWVRARLAQDGLTIEPQAISLLLDGTGLSLSRIRAESEKLALFAAGERTITPQHVREIVRPDGDEPGEGFPMGNAIWSGNARAALREVSAQFDKGFSEFQILGQIRAAARGIKPEDRARRALGEVLKTDLALKSHEREGKVRYLIERLAIELCQR